MTLPQDINDKEDRKFSEVSGKVAINVSNPDGTTVQPKKYFYKEKLADSGNTYLLKEAGDGAWLTQKLVDATVVMTYATITNNPTVTSYTAAKTAYLTLTYGTPVEAGL